MKNKQFNDWYEGLALRDVEQTRLDIIDKCKITPQIFRDWRTGRTSIPELAKPIINEIAGTDVFCV